MSVKTTHLLHIQYHNLLYANPHNTQVSHQ